MTEVKLAQGDYLMRQGDVADAFYVVLSGTISVQVTRAGDEHPSEVMQIADAQFIGERALINDAPRAADALGEGHVIPPPPPPPDS